jgi:hypothetical protein
MIVSAVPGADPPYALVEGIQSSRALSTFIRAVMQWHAFGRYDYLIVDLNSFGDWSPKVVDELAAVASTAADAGHWLAFFPVASRWMCGAGDGRLHGFSDRAHAQLAMREHWFAQAQVSVARSPLMLTLGSWRETAVRRVPYAHSWPVRRFRWGRA